MNIDTCIRFNSYEELWNHFRDRIADKASIPSDCLLFGDWEGKIVTAHSAEEIKPFSFSKWGMFRREFPQTSLVLKKGLYEVSETYVTNLDKMFRFTICKSRYPKFFFNEFDHDGLDSALPTEECGKIPMPEYSDDLPHSYWDLKKGSIVVGLSSLTLGCAVASAMVCKQLFKRQSAREAIKNTITLITLVASGLTSGYFAHQIYSS